MVKPWKQLPMPPIPLNPTRNLRSRIKELETRVAILESETDNLIITVGDLSACLTDTNGEMVMLLAKESCAEKDTGKEVGRCVNQAPHVKHCGPECYDGAQEAKVFEFFIWDSEQLMYSYSK